MASFMPPASKQTNQVGYQQQRYDSTKKINGTMGPPPGVGPTPSQPQTSSPPQQQMAMKVRPTSGQPQTQDMNGIAVIDALTNPGSGSGVANAANQSGGNGPQNFSGIYGNDADNYLPPTVVAPGGGHGGRPDMSNGLYGQHELVAAISQITAEPPTAVGQQPQQQNKAFNKAKKLWSASEAAGGQGQAEGQKGQNDTEAVSKGPPRGFGGQRPASGQGRSGGGRGGYSGGQNNEMNLASDSGAASDSLSSTSEEVGNNSNSVASAASAPMTGEIGDNGKPLSFARIASLNLEKQALQARAAAASAASSGKGVSNPTSTNANASMANNEAMIMSTASMASMNNSNLQAAAAAAASMANMTMAEAAAVAAAQQVMFNSLFTS